VSATSALMLYLMGNKSKWGPRLGLLNQALWIIYAIGLEQYGLLPGIALYTIVHLRNLYHWEARRPLSSSLPTLITHTIANILLNKSLWHDEYGRPITWRQALRLTRHKPINKEEEV